MDAWWIPACCLSTVVIHCFAVVLSHYCVRVAASCRQRERGYHSLSFVCGVPPEQSVTSQKCIALISNVLTPTRCCLPFALSMGSGVRHAPNKGLGSDRVFSRNGCRVTYVCIPPYLPISIPLSHPTTLTASPWSPPTPAHNPPSYIR